MDAASERIKHGRLAVLSISKAAALLPMRRERAVAAIRAAGIVRLVGNKELVVFGDVLDRVLVPKRSSEAKS
jgi:hypothetical protein